MADVPQPARNSKPSRFAIGLIAALTLVIVSITLVGILKSRRDSYVLLVRQGTAFTEALALACTNTIVAESYYDRLISDRYDDLVEDLTAKGADQVSGADLAAFADRYDLPAVFVFDTAGRLLQSDLSNSSMLAPPPTVDSAVRRLVSDFQRRSAIIHHEDTSGDEPRLYYLRVTDQLDRVVALAVGSGLYEEAVMRTGIGVLAQNMADEPGIEYIVYQAPEGIIFSSLRGGTFVSIDSDSFLKEALDSDTVTTRRTDFRDREVLELVRPFSTRRFPFGLLRVGVSLDGYFAVSRGFDRLMIILSLSLFALLVVGVLYAAGRQERAGLRKDISDIRSVSEQIFSEIDTGVAVIGPDNSIRFANRAFENIFGSRAVTGRKVNELAAPVAETVAGFIGSQTGPRETELILDAGGEERTILMGRSTLSLEEPARSGVVVVATDITQLRKYQQAAARKERLSELGHLAAGVAHEIRNPLNAISIAAQRLEGEITPVDHRDEFLSFTGQIRTEARRLNEIITKFLSLTRGEQKTQSRVDPSVVCSEFERLVKAEAAGLNIQISVTCEPRLNIAVPADRFKELLLNLYNNSKEALTGNPGKIVVSVRRNDRHAVVSVSDSGPGIPEALRAKIFAPYFTTKEGGTGIGLAVVHQIVEESGGTVAITDSHLGGAEIAVSLPLV
ncbi:MAG: PAS domain S-box protein [candidate division Zixibacteria bacterium]|nr:PAS domain S-box protein [candidate division Zixibacteria bacterium]